MLPGVLDALEAQTCAATFEIVVVDNASTDGTRNLLEARGARDARYRVLFEPILGRSVAMNAGAAAARGGVLVFTDDDVVVAPDWIEVLPEVLPIATHGIGARPRGPDYPIAHDLGRWPCGWETQGCAISSPPDWGAVEREPLRPPE